MNPAASARSTLRYTAGGTNIVFHGNSLVLGQSGATVPQGAMPYQVQRLDPVNNVLTCVNLGANGQSWDQMRAGASTVDGYFDPAKRNVLICWEGHNQIHNAGSGSTAAGAYALAQAYVADRLAAHPWTVVHMTLLPARYSAASDSDTNALNAVFTDYNARLRAGYRDAGAKALIDVRQQGSPFAVTDYSAAALTAIGLWSTGDGGQWVHLSDAGYAACARICAAVLRQLPAR